MDMVDLLTPQAVRHGVPVADKPALLHWLAAEAAALTGADAPVILAALTAREALGATGFGAGTAIPHARLPGLGATFALVVQLAAPIDYAAIDGAPVDLVVLLLAPAQVGAAVAGVASSGADHLKALARISRMLRDTTMVARLRAAGSAEALFALLRGYERGAAHSRAA